LEIRKPVELRLSPNVPAPFTKGFRKPVVYLPQSALNWNEQQLSHVLCHELAHIQRKDIVIITIQNILNVFYFFHPLVWIANHHLNFQREKICDDTAIAILNENPVRYGRTLMDNLESFLVYRRLPLIANGLFFSKKTIIRRFEYLLNRGKEIKMNLDPFQKAAIGMLSILIILTACNNQSDENPVYNADLPSSNSNVKFIPYDSPPSPIGGFAAIQKNVIYPEADREAGHEGTVIVQAFVDKNGNVSDTTAILKSPGFQGLENAAIEALKKTKFKPAMQEEKPVGVYITIPVIFKFEKDNDR
jgi:TonB family protein